MVSKARRFTLALAACVFLSVYSASAAAELSTYQSSLLTYAGVLLALADREKERLATPGHDSKSGATIQLTDAGYKFVFDDGYISVVATASFPKLGRTGIRESSETSLRLSGDEVSAVRAVIDFRKTHISTRSIDPNDFGTVRRYRGTVISFSRLSGLPNVIGCGPSIDYHIDVLPSAEPRVSRVVLDACVDHPNGVDERYTVALRDEFCFVTRAFCDFLAAHRRGRSRRISIAARSRTGRSRDLRDDVEHESRLRLPFAADDRTRVLVLHALMIAAAPRRFVFFCRIEAEIVKRFGERPREFLRAVRDRRRAVDRKSRADVALYKSSRPHAALDGRTPDAVYFAQSLRKIAA